MAKQIGPYPLTGLMGNVSMYKSPFGYLARESGGHNRSKVLKHPNFRQTRNNAAEFKNAMLGAVQLRRAIGHFLRPIANSWLSGRMNGVMLKMVKSDMVHARGERIVACGDVELLECFEFNHLTPLNNVLPVFYSSSMDTEAGTMQLKVSSFIPRERMKSVEGSTHFKIVSIGAVIDFEKKKHKYSEKQSELLELGYEEVEAICMNHSLIVEKGEIMVLAMGVLFYKLDEKGNEKRMKGGAMRVVQAGRA